MSDLGDKLRGAAGDGAHAYSTADVARSGQTRRMRRRGAGALAALGLVAGGFVIASGDDNSSSPSETIDQPDGTETSIPVATSLPDESSTTSSTSTPVDSSACAAPMDEASVLAPGLTSPSPGDLDGDGTPDQINDARAADGGWMIQAVRSSDGGFSTPFALSGTFGGVILDSGDIDGDGLDEAFLSQAGNTLLTGVIIELDGCTLRAIATDEPAFDYGDGIFLYPFSSGGNGCSPTGCHNSVVCHATSTGVVLELIQIYPLVSALDPDFDSEVADAIDPDDLEVVVDRQTVRVTDGRAVIVNESSTVTRRGAAELVPVWALPGVNCGALKSSAENCTTVPTFTTPAGWSRASEELETDGTHRWTVWNSIDGTTVQLSNPGPAIIGRGSSGSLDLGAPFRARIGSIGHDGLEGPFAITWSLSDDRTGVFCEQWTLTGDDVGPLELVAFAAEAFGAGAPEWDDDEPRPYLTDEEVSVMGEAVLEEMLDWAWNAGPPPPSLSPDTTVNRYLNTRFLGFVDAEDVFADDNWFYLDGDRSGVNVLGMFGAIREWDIIVDYESTCPAPFPGSPGWPPAVHQLTFTPSGGGDGCSLGDIALDLFLHGDGTVHTIRVDSFEP